MYDAIIIGSGPAGLMAANAINEKSYVVLERNNSAGKKLLITGGGRCNVTNLKDNREFLETVEYNKKFLYSTLSNFGPYDIVDFLDTVPLVEVEENQMFPQSNKASDILEKLLENTNENICYNQEVRSIKYHQDYIEVKTTNTVYKAKNIVIACGGCSFPKTGSRGDHITFANKLGIDIVNVYPAETGIMLLEKNNLAGIHFDNVVISLGKIKKDGHFIFTHKGISGNAPMKMSEFVYLQKAKEIYIDFLPNISTEEIKDILLQNKEKQTITVLSSLVTKRFSEYLVEKSSIDKKLKIKQLIHRQIDEIIDLLKNHRYHVTGVEPLEGAYVTGGGISIKEITAKTMETRKYPGIYVVGESLDIHGPIGGYNITLAMSTGYTAGKSIVEKLEVEKEG